MHIVQSGISVGLYHDYNSVGFKSKAEKHETYFDYFIQVFGQNR